MSTNNIEIRLIRLFIHYTQERSLHLNISSTCVYKNASGFYKIQIKYITTYELLCFADVVSKEFIRTMYSIQQQTTLIFQNAPYEQHSQASTFVLRYIVSPDPRLPGLCSVPCMPGAPCPRHVIATMVNQLHEISRT